MDPDACYDEMCQAMHDGDYRTARERAEALQVWLTAGGFYPTKRAQSEVDAYLALVLQRTSHIQLD